MTSIVLILMVRNESRVIRRCLTQAIATLKPSGALKGILVADTGSTDGTLDTVLREFQSDIPVHACVHEWKDFGTNRTLSFTEAQRWAKEDLGLVLGYTYALFLDADMLLQGPFFKKEDVEQLRLPGYTLVQHNTACGLHYPNLRLARMDLSWFSVGVTHEHWATKEGAAFKNPLESLWIDDLDDGGSKSNKLGRDIELMTAGLEKEPGNPRYLFYLGRTLVDAYGAAVQAQGADFAPLSHEREEFRKGIRMLLDRAKLSDFPEEAWYARYRAGLALTLLSEPLQGVATLLQAHAERPHRHEPLLALSRYYRSINQPAVGAMFAERALHCDPGKDLLFVGSAAKEEALEEVMLTGWYAPGKRKLGHAAAERLSRLPSFDRANFARQQLAFYAQPLMHRAVRLGKFQVPKEFLQPPEVFLGRKGETSAVYVPKNPSMVRTYSGDYLVHIPVVNYSHRDGVVFRPNDPDGIVRTRNLLFEWDPVSGELSAGRELAVTLPDGWRHDVAIRGLEDLRLFLHAGYVWFTATCWHGPREAAQTSDPSRPHPSVVLGRILPDRESVDHLSVLDFDGAGPTEKNWLPRSFPYQLNAPMRLLYSVSPWRGLDVLDPMVDGRCVGSTRVEAADFPHLRGGTLLAELSSTPEHLVPAHGFGHEVAFYQGRRIYLHRAFRIYHPTPSMLTMSPLFTLTHSGVEYIIGCTRLPSGNLLITYGNEERDACWLEITPVTFDSLIRSGAELEELLP